MSRWLRSLRWLPAIVLGLGACSFSSTAVPGTPDLVDAGAADGAAASDGATGGLDDVVNVRAPDEFLGTADLDILGGATIDTSALTVSTGVPAGVTFTAAPQDGLGADLAILHVRGFESTATISVVGSRALVILADNVSFGGTLVVSTPGAGFAATGGGAIEIYARTQLTIGGSITAGSAGGQTVAATGQDRGSGGGGGGGGGVDGGEIVLQAPVVSNTGRLTASGGSGAGGDGFPGRIVLLYRTRVDPGITIPTAETTTY